MDNPQASTQVTFATISVTDPAIDTNNSDLELFKLTRDMAHIKFLPGKTPTYFHIRKLPLSIKTWLKNRESVGDSYKYLDAFCAGVERIDGSGAIITSSSNEETEGNCLYVPMQKMTLGKTTLSLWNTDDLDTILGERFDVIMEIGSVVWGLLFLKGSTSSKFPFLAI